MTRDEIVIICKKVRESLQYNLDYLVKLNQNQDIESQENSIIELIKKALVLLETVDVNNIGDKIEDLGLKIANKELNFATPYGRGIKIIGTNLKNKSTLNFTDVLKATDQILIDLRVNEIVADEAIMFWEGFHDSILKGEREKLTLSDSIKKAIKENHWPMTRSQIDIDEHILFFCTRIAMTNCLETM